jgi:ABC-type protease/lipase transport system fused ATPase/permease subunit
VPLLRGTIRRNVAYGNPRASEEDIVQALERAGVVGEIDALPGGLDARVTEGGRNLSPALRLRIALARALLGEPPIVLIDLMGLGGDGGFKSTLGELFADYPGTIVIATDDPDITAAASMKIMAGRRTEASQPSAEIIPFRAL